MKKLILTFAGILFLVTTTQAQVYANSTSEEPFVEVIEAQDEYKTIEVSELPEAVTASIARDYEEAETTEAWVKKDEGKSVYKIKINVNDEEKELFADAEGNWIEEKDDKLNP